MLFVFKNYWFKDSLRLSSSHETQRILIEMVSYKNIHTHTHTHTHTYTDTYTDRHRETHTPNAQKDNIENGYLLKKMLNLFFKTTSYFTSHFLFWEKFEPSFWVNFKNSTSSSFIKEDLKYSANQECSYLWINFVFSRITLSKFL